MGEQKKYWEGKHFAFYTNKECEYYPVSYTHLTLPTIYSV